MIHLRDGIDGLLSLEAGSVSLVLSDLPSGETAAEFDRKPNLRMLWHAVWHALRPDGIAIFMASHFEFAMELARSTPFFRYEMIWDKSMPTGFLNAKKRPLKSHEYVMVFFREEGFYEPQMRQGFGPISANYGAGRPEPRRDESKLSENYGRIQRRTPSRIGATDRYPVSVLTFGSLATRSRERTHPQQKPGELLQNLICTYCPPEGLVVDPFAGSGSTLRAAVAEGHPALGFDTSPRFAPRSMSDFDPITQTQAKDVSP